MIKLSLKEAKKMRKYERVIILSQRDTHTVLSLIEYPPVANARLTAAWNQHKEFFRKNHGIIG
ncbi:hypothetical protein IQ278_14935 [Tolypothrix sp. LEGE 11397]|uniref:type II toxin -antitoxin system TacA 1-like antitoxin n=1 Tax=Tolypothrix sp. PCC 7712 TaxID=2596898 RepID=UPI0005EAC2ED|nr:DUF1778 domain-containing protein [Tolypothrix sp. PCC 7712]EKE98820.1 toxin-antitoxin system, antitoxin component, ribbon-helix-helix fold domain protein [Tolypothrix sp. PCC 7601]MBE9083404.1 hypothetical protein [Tolypothrix sp. LEGE 11397]BAY90355.1 hypothetical protein NIES3275_23670 [Microchaete diplosiphon NIES-3275]UYD24534.1 hypothetical protein HGR01_24235 [Tolypothrix sp. PCC 7712]UYD33237.1 hypothetical protein HG267_30435 [Tolypothrix sp. PCC 7601]